jgi:Fe-S cluster assembly scaffold protein SufB
MGLYGVLSTQDVRLVMVLEPGSAATVWSHCLFDAPQKARHAMQAEVRIMEGARLKHEEIHHHGASGEIEVLPCARVVVERNARYVSEFTLVHGRVGRLDIDYEVAVGPAALAELTTRIYGFGADRIRLRERLRLDGVESRGQVKSRIAVRDEATADVFGILEGNAAGARGHMDCTEIVRDRAQVSAVPEVRVRHPQAKVTHEAAIGSVDGRQLETLMARGLEPDAAVDLIVRGMLA